MNYMSDKHFGYLTLRHLPRNLPPIAAMRCLAHLMVFACMKAPSLTARGFVGTL